MSGIHTFNSLLLIFSVVLSMGAFLVPSFVVALRIALVVVSLVVVALVVVSLFVVTLSIISGTLLVISILIVLALTVADRVVFLLRKLSLLLHLAIILFKFLLLSLKILCHVFGSMHQLLVSALEFQPIFELVLRLGEAEFEV